MPRLIPITSLLLLAPATVSCGDEPSRSSGTLVDAGRGGVVESDDGRLRLEIPPGALAEDTEITVSLTPRDQWPAELAQLEPAAGVYDMQPGGLRFASPVRVVHTLEHDGETDFPALFGVTRSGDGSMSLLDRPITYYDVETGTATVTTELHHFSDYVSSSLRRWRWDSETGRFLPDSSDYSMWIRVELTGWPQHVWWPWYTDVELRNGGAKLFAAQTVAFGTGDLVLLDGSRLRSAVELTEEEEPLGVALWQCNRVGSGKATVGFMARRADATGTLVGVFVAREHACVTRTPPGYDTGAGVESEGEEWTTGGWQTATSSSGGWSSGGWSSGDSTSGGTSGGWASDASTSSGSTSGEGADGAEPWHGCLEQPPELCEPCCARLSEDDARFEQCIAGCG